MTKEYLYVVKSDGHHYSIGDPFASIKEFVSGGEALAQWFGLDTAVLLHEDGRWLWWSPSHNRWVVLDAYFQMAPSGTRRWLARQNGNDEKHLLKLLEHETHSDVLQDIAEHKNASAAVIEKVAAVACAHKHAELIIPLARLDNSKHAAPEKFSSLDMKFSEATAWMLFQCFKDDPLHVGLLVGGSARGRAAIHAGLPIAGAAASPARSSSVS